MAKKHSRVPRYAKDAAAANREAEQIKQEKARAARARTRIQADLSQQAPSEAYQVVKLHYEDMEFTCADCGRQETWTARQQQWWYEVAKGSRYSTAVRCRECRRARHAGHTGDAP